MIHGKIQIAPQEPIQGHKAGFSMKGGTCISLEQELLILKENGFKVTNTVKGIMISKE